MLYLAFTRGHLWVTVANHATLHIYGSNEDLFPTPELLRNLLQLICFKGRVPLPSLQISKFYFFQNHFFRK